MEENEKIEEEKTQLEDKKVEVVEEVIHEQTSDENSKQDSKGLSIASLVLGIASFFVSKLAVVSIACAILAIVFGIKGQKRAGKGMAKAGFILGIVYLSLYVLILILVAIVGISFGTALFSALI